MNKKIVLVGPTASGKNYLRDKLAKRGFTFDVSYTTREIRNEVGEVDGLDYHFISDAEFDEKLNSGGFYENVEYNGFKYGTGTYEWENRDVFIMEPHGIECITDEDRENCFIIYINPPIEDRVNRMRDERKWNDKQVNDRLKTDGDKFGDFSNYDLVISTPEF